MSKFTDDELRGLSQKDLVIYFFTNNPLRDIPHTESVPWLVNTFQRLHNAPFADPDRAIRSVAQNGCLIKIAKGVYKYDPDFIHEPELEDFSAADKAFILERDGYKCTICGLGVKDGLELHVDHIKPKDLGGKATVENGQVLCAPHNFKKKNYNQTESGKAMFIRLLKLAKKDGDQETEAFCTAVLKVYEDFNQNGHIEWR